MRKTAESPHRARTTITTGQAFLRRARVGVAIMYGAWVMFNVTQNLTRVTAGSLCSTAAAGSGFFRLKDHSGDYVAPLIFPQRALTAVNAFRHHNSVMVFAVVRDTTSRSVLC